MKICCITSVEEARCAVEAGADVLGLVARMPSGPIDDALIAEIAAAAPDGIDTFLLTSATGPDAVADHVRRCGTTTVQLVDVVPIATYRELRKSCPSVAIVQVLHVTGPATVDAAHAVAPYVDTLLLDSGNPTAAIKELGGTGRVHDWTISRRIVEAAAVPVFLARGLNAGNVGAAIRAVRPHGVDLCSGVRAGGELDPDKLAAYIGAVREAA
ncbi:MAG: phosphoribosylanthranilate isomerase [Alphaproteobacteria bacterium]|nr:phosphoribosylanthranilate isomerase [Alphaproteobacteria bacterium]